MKNITKTNILFSFMVTLYILLIFLVRIIPMDVIGVNARLVLPELVMLIPAFLYVTYMKPASLKETYYDFPQIGVCALIIVFTWLLMPSVSLINTLSSLFVENQVEATFSVLSENSLAANLITLAVIPAICEEYIFRGIIFGSYKRRNPFKAVILSSLLFGLIHMNVNQFIYAFIMGCIFCLLVYATNTVMSSILAHMFFNGYNVITAWYAADTLNGTTGGETMENIAIPGMVYFFVYAFMTVMAAGMAVAAFFVFKAICKRTRGFKHVKLIFEKENRRMNVEEEGKFFDPYIFVGIGLCLIYIVLYGI